jgi:Sulfotransferase family
MTGHLIHIGYAKTGSNFLRRWFAQHPQLAYAEGGIAGFPDLYSIVREGASRRDRPLYRVTSAEGFSTPHANFGQENIDYENMERGSMPSSQAEVCRSLAMLFPTAHILIVTRGFRSMILSGYSQYVRTGGDESLAGLCAAAASTGQQGPWNYDYLIGLYRRAFGEAKVIVLPYELLRDDPAAFLDQIAQRLGLVQIEMSTGRLNPSLSQVELAWYPRLARATRSLPLGRRGRRKAWQLYLRAAMTNRLCRPIALLQRLWPMTGVTDALLTPELMEGYRGFATTLRDDPLYRAYAQDYLFDRAIQ